MGCNVRGRSIRNNRRSRHSAKPPPPDPIHPASAPIAAASDADPINPTASNPSLDLNLTPNPNPIPNPSVGVGVGVDDAGWGYCTEEQLEELLLKNLDFVYKEALARLVSMGYDEALSLRAVLCNGHCYGSTDVLSNILHNAIAYLTAPPQPDGSPPPAASAPSFAFSDLRHLQEYSLASMVCLLQQVRPHLTRGDAMWCLLMSDLHVGRASTVDIPSLAPASAATATGDFAPGICRLHAAASSGGGDSSLCCPRHFVLPKPLLKASGCRPSRNPPSCSPSEQMIAEEDAAAKDSQESDIVASVMKSLESMSITEEKAVPDAGTADDHKKEMIFDLIRQIRELEGQVKERREWAQQKALQAARKLSSDLAELNTLRAEREENQRAKKGKQALEDSTMKRLSEMEAALKKASGQVDRANAAVRRLETENAEIRAEMEASKLSASESVSRSLEVAKREKKNLKRLLAWEKQREKLHEDISEERRKTGQLQQQLNEVHESQKETELKWRQEIKAKEGAIALAEEERRAKETAEVSIKRRHEALRQKIEIDFHRHKDDIQRLEEELSRLQASARSTQPSNPTSNTLRSGGTDVSRASSRKKNRSRECIICTQDEVSVVFLPCTHQVLCARCSEEHEERGEASCPCCKVQIEERIRVYGVST